MGAQEMRDNVNVAAMIEVDFDRIVNYAQKVDSVTTEAPKLSGGLLNDYEVLHYGTYDRGEKGECYKAVILRDPDGNVYVHYNGTGNGNWEENAVAYGPQNGKTTSDVQDWSLKFFNEYMEDYGEKIEGNLYVTGHSQGGNNAQFVTIRSKYGQRITNCISMDGPGFSSQSVEESKNQYGEIYYEQQREKIYAFNGEYDYVSCLGQEQLVPEDHVTYISYDYENRGLDLMYFHDSRGLFDTNGGLGEFITEDSEFREFVLALNDRIKDLPPEQQREIALTVMKICEGKIGGGPEALTDILTQEELDRLLELLIPVLVEMIEENPEMISRVMEELQLPDALVDVVNALIDEFNEFPPEYREKAIALLLEGLVVKNGEVTFDKEKLGVWSIVAAAAPLVFEVLLHHPEDVPELINVLCMLGVDKMIIDYLIENPAAALTVVAVLGVLLVTELEDLIALIDAIVHIVAGAMEIAAEVRDFIVKTLQALKEGIEKIKEWYRQNFDKGVKYVRNNPYFKVDTDRMRSYAQRLRDVNRRLEALDEDLNDLYWQVGFLDLWDILLSNVLTDQSYALGRAASYLDTSADEFDEAEAKAYRYMTGG